MGWPMGLRLGKIIGRVNETGQDAYASTSSQTPLRTFLEASSLSTDTESKDDDNNTPVSLLHPSSKCGSGPQTKSQTESHYIYGSWRERARMASSVSAML